MITVEIRKLFGRRRTWISIFLLCLLPTVVAIFLSLTDIGPRPGEGPAFLSAVLTNGALYPAAALGLVLPVFLPIAVSIVAGESIAGEASAGTLRYLLTRPIGRTRLLVAKLSSISLFVLVAVLAVAITALVVGVNLLGSGPVFATTTVTSTLSGTPLTPQQLGMRTVLTVIYIGWSMLGVASISFFLSTLTDSPLAAALGGFSALVASTALVALDAADAVRDYLPTRYWLAWVDFFRDPILWRDIQRGFLVQGVYVVILLGMAWANFSTRDVTS